MYVPMHHSSVPQDLTIRTGNPILGVSCRNIAKSVSDTICLEPPGDDDYTPPRTSPAATTTSTILPSAAPVPSDISNGTAEVCAQYYRVETGDYCNKIILKYTISLDDFLFLNQGINKNCTNLFAKESYCVQPVGPIEKYPDHPDYVPPFTSVSEIRFDDLPEATFKIPRKTDSPKKLPLAKGTRKECYIYVDGSDLHTEDTWVLDESECKALAGTWKITLEELQSWSVSSHAPTPYRVAELMLCSSILTGTHRLTCHRRTVRWTLSIDTA
jgi:hypothetical protein